MFVRSLSAVLLLASFALVTGLTGCASTTPTAPIRDPAQPSVAYYGARNLPSHGVALEGHCPVAYFASGTPYRGSPEFASTYDGVTYYLASAEAQELFDREPQKYVPAFGGWCAFGMSVEDKFPVDPENFKIVDGRLMLFLKNPAVDARALWNQGDERELLARAEAHWAKVSN